MALFSLGLALGKSGHAHFGNTGGHARGLRTIWKRQAARKLHSWPAHDSPPSLDPFSGLRVFGIVAGTVERPGSEADAWACHGAIRQGIRVAHPVAIHLGKGYSGIGGLSEARAGSRPTVEHPPRQAGLLEVRGLVRPVSGRGTQRDPKEPGSRGCQTGTRTPTGDA